MQLILIQPQVIQFSRETTQYIKIINNTVNVLNNFFFCLYNVQKFSFEPETFQLLPKEHKLVKITLKLKNGKSIAKQFAYLKSNDINKRLTLLINNFQSPEQKQKHKITEQGYSDMNTLSSRDYHQLHSRALNKIVKQQQKYITNHNNTNPSLIIPQHNHDFTNHIMNSSNKKQNYYNTTQQFNLSNHKNQYLNQLQIKSNYLEKQVKELNSILNTKCMQLQKIAQQNIFLEEQGSKFIKKLSDKQQRIKQLQDLYQKIVFQNENYASQMKSVNDQLRRKQLMHKQQHSQIYKGYQSRIKQLQNVVSASQSTDREQILRFKKEFKNKVTQKQNQLSQIRRTLEHQQLLVKQHQINILKLQNDKKNIQNDKKKVQQSNRQMEQLNNNLRDQLYVYKSKVQESSISGSKVQEYLQIALQTYKNQNQSLKRSKNDLQRSLQNFVKTARQTDQQKKSNHQKIDLLNRQIIKLRQQLLFQQSRNQQLKDQNHRKLIQIKNQNIRLLERLTQQQSTKRQQIISRLNREIQDKNKQIQEKQFQINQLRKSTSRKSQIENQNRRLLQQNQKLQQKVKKYKKQTKKQLKSINENAFDELKRIHEQKKQLSKKVQRLQKTLQNINSSCQYDQNDRQKTRKDHSKSRWQKTYYNQNKNEQQNQNSRSRSQYETGGRKIGIYNQRKYLQQSQSHSVNNQPSQVNLYQLYELRQFQNFIKNQQQKFQHIFSLGFDLINPLDYNGKPLENIKPLYRAIKFFKVLQMKFKSLQQKVDQSVIINKQNQFLKQKLTDLQRKQQNNMSIINQNNHKQVDNSQSFMNRSVLKSASPLEIIEFMKEQMKKQYNKQKQSLKFNEDKYEILKKKIYREYRTRIIQLLNLSSTNGPSSSISGGLLNKKDKTSGTGYLNIVSRIQDTIERFIQNLSNLSHKQALLSRQIKIKQTLKLQNSKLRQRINDLQHIVNQKNSYCNRDPVKIFTLSNLISNGVVKQQQWIQSIKLSTQLLTSKAENQRLVQEIQIIRQDCNDLRENLNHLTQQNDQKDSQIIKLKRDQLELERNYQKQLEKQNLILQDTKNKLSLNSQSKGKNKITNKQKSKQIDSLKDQLEKKTQQLKNFKQKQKKWQTYLQQSNKVEQKQRKITNSYKRLQQNTAILNQQNKDLRNKNQNLKEQVDRLDKQLQRKKLYIKNLKGQQQQNRIKPYRIQQSLQQIKDLQDALKNAKDQLIKVKKNKDKQILKLQGDIISVKNQTLIQIKSLQSIIRAMLQTLRKLFGSLKIIIRKRGLSVNLRSQFLVPENLVQINASEIYDQFQQILQIIEK